MLLLQALLEMFHQISSRRSSGRLYPRWVSSTTDLCCPSAPPTEFGSVSRWFFDYVRSMQSCWQLPSTSWMLLGWVVLKASDWINSIWGRTSSYTTGGLSAARFGTCFPRQDYKYSVGAEFCTVSIHAILYERTQTFYQLYGVKTCGGRVQVVPPSSTWEWSQTDCWWCSWIKAFWYCWWRRVFYWTINIHQDHKPYKHHMRTQGYGQHMTHMLPFCSHVV